MQLRNIASYADTSLESALLLPVLLTVSWGLQNPQYAAAHYNIRERRKNNETIMYYSIGPWRR